ncbi:MAG: type II secretion system protein [Planctomycetota bacterium]
MRAPSTRGGFTLLELIIVLVIMGFLIAMVAPKLANVSGSAVDTVCDTNQNRLRTFLNIATTQEGKLPTKLTSPVIGANAFDGSADFSLAAGFPAGGPLPDDVATLGDLTDGFRPVSDQDETNGQDFLAAEFMERNHLHVHILSADEASELKSMGVAKVLTYGKADGSAAELEEMYIETDVVAGTPVLMIGTGADDSDPAAGTFAPLADDNYGHPELIGRIVLGISPDAALVANGLVENAPNCPGGLQNEGNAQYNWYNIIVPRLAATVSRADYEAAITAYAGADGNITATSFDNGQIKTINLLNSDEEEGAQPIWKSSSACPEGHQWPVAETSTWDITG